MDISQVHKCYSKVYSFKMLIIYQSSFSASNRIRNQVKCGLCLKASLSCSENKVQLSGDFVTRLNQTDIYMITISVKAIIFSESFLFDIYRLSV